MTIPKILRKFIVDSNGEIVYETKVLTFWILGIIASVIFGLLLSIPFSFVSGGFWKGIAINQGITIGFILASFFSWFYFSTNREFNLNLGLENKKWMKVIPGFLLGLSILTLVALTGFGLGFFHFSVKEISIDQLGIFLFQTVSVFIFFTFSAVNEELMFRGFPLQVNLNVHNMWYRVIFLSTIFSVLHALNANITWLGFINIFLAGIWLSFGAVSENTIWYSFGLHLGWNFTQTGIFNFPVSGENFFPDVFFIHVDVSNSVNDLLTGGKFGPEGSVLATVLILIAIFYERSKIKW